MTEFSAIRLVKIGDNIAVSIEVDGQWIEVIRENASGPISHIVEPTGITAAIAKQRK